MGKKKVIPDNQPALNDQQRLFAEHYAVHLNATKAAIYAGYSEKTAYSNGPRLLKNAEVRAYIDELLRARAIGRDEILARLTDMATFDIALITNDKGHLDFVKAAQNGMTWAIKSISRRETKYGEDVKFEVHDQMAALIQLGRAYGMFTDNHDITSGGKPISWGQVITEAGAGENESGNPYT